MLTLNPNHYLHSAKDLNAYPHFVTRESAQELSRFHSILWVQHPVSKIWWPWLAAQHEYEFMHQLGQGIHTLTAAQQEYGRAVGLLIDPVEVLAAQRKFLTDLDACRELMNREHYCKLPRITFDTYYNTVNYWVSQVQNEMTRDTQVELRINKHNASLFKSVHDQLCGIVQLVADEPIKSSYCYMSVYQPGAVLVKHTDRPQCRWNASIMFAKSTEYTWPIYVENKAGQPIEVRADLGEVVVYRGTDVPHWRNALPDGTQTACFFHFVRQEFQGSLR